MDKVYVIVQNDRDYTNSGCRNIGIQKTLHAAKASAWLSLIDHVSKPWMPRLFRKKDGGCCVPDFYIEEWDASGLSATWRLGWTIEANTHKSAIDKHLKGTNNLDQTISQWRSELSEGRLPATLDELTVLAAS